MLKRTALLVALMGPWVSGQAAVISVDDAFFGTGALTRDTAQGLDFLDVNFADGRSFDDVSGEFGAGGDFAGFRYATEAEVIALINNFGFSPTATAGSLVTSSGDALSGLIALVGTTATDGANNFAIAVTSTDVSPNKRMVALQDAINPSSNDEVQANLIKDPANANDGSWLVRAAGVPEPFSLVLMMTGLAGIGFSRRARGVRRG